MPRLGLSSLKNRDGGARGEHDRFPLVVKVAAFVVATGIVVGFLLLSGGGRDEAVRNPAVPTISDAGGSGEAPPPPPPSVTVAVPAVGTHTAVIAPEPDEPEPKPTARPKPTPRPPGRDVRFARVGQPCPREGAFAFDPRFEPLVCRNGSWDSLL